MEAIREAAEKYLVSKDKEREDLLRRVQNMEAALLQEKKSRAAEAEFQRKLMEREVAAKLAI